MSELAALVVFSIVSSGSPGPNNVLLWVSGLRFGTRSTLPHVIGTAAGIGAMAVMAAAGLGAFITGVPVVEFVLKLAGSLYLLYLAHRIAVSDAIRRAEVARPLSLMQATVFQGMNPKAWIFVLAAVSAFRPAELPIVAGSALVVATMMIVVMLTAVIWASGGAVIDRLVTGDRAHRITSVTLAALLAGSVVQLWI